MTESIPVNPLGTDEDEIALWGTQGGDLARWDADEKAYVWHELPDWYAGSGINEKVGDPIPKEWDMIPTNEAARQEMLRDEEDPDDSYDGNPEYVLGKRLEMYNS